MALTRDNWPSAQAIRDSLMAQFTLPLLPAAVHDWLAWYAALPPGVHLRLPDERPERDEAWGDSDEAHESFGTGVLTGIATVDVPSLYQALHGYRFVLDQARSTPEHLIWQDVAGSGDGDWQPHWLALQNMGGDPLIADLRAPEVPIQTAWHGAGRWDAQPLFTSLAELMQTLVVDEPIRPSPTRVMRVQLVDLGPQPMKVLLALKQHAVYRDWTSSQLMQLKHALPLTLADGWVSGQEHLVDRLVQRYEALGARMVVSTRLSI